MKQIKFNKYSGLRIKGIKSAQCSTRMHLDLASTITGEIESGGLFGTVMNYDGTGMTAGFHQAIAVYPRVSEEGLKSQGPLWKLLARMFSLSPVPIELVDFMENMYDYGMILSEDGKVRMRSNGSYATGTKIRAFFGTPYGQLAPHGKDRLRAEVLIQQLHGLMADERTFKLQLNLGKEHFIKASDRIKLRFSKVLRTRSTTIQDSIYGPLTRKTISTLTTEEMDPCLNLAMCMFWSYFVNAPGMALKKLCQTVDSFDRRSSDWKEAFSGRLVRRLGTSSYGRWDDDIDSGRYQRTRKELMKYFDAIMFRPGSLMPEDFPGV